MSSLAVLFTVSLFTTPSSHRGPDLADLELELARLEATLPAEPDSTTPSVMIGLGGAGLAVGVVGAIVGFTSAPCVNEAPAGTGSGPGAYGTYAGGYGVGSRCVDHREDWGLIGPMIALASIGGVVLAVGVVSLLQSGAPWRRRDRLRRRIERLHDSLALDVHIAPAAAAVSVSGRF